ncbi:MAG: hypothetical protein LBE47_02815 [Methanomassiliicoccaceae archaeon]|jgi:hypothetical protein|nr:hypothetical protein [Methanomassiliicoccaceae archaeon]
MGTDEKMKLKMSNTVTVMIFCGVFGLLSLVQAWITYPVTFNIPGVTVATLSYSETGLKGISEGAYQPMLVLIAAILALALVPVELIKKGRTITKAMLMLAGSLIVVGTTLVLIDVGSFATNFTIPATETMVAGAVSAGVSLYVIALFGAFVVVVPALQMLGIMPDWE